MSGSYRECGECGKRALKFATRCPGCGRDLPSPAPFGEGASPDLRRFLSLNGFVTVLALSGAVVWLQHGSSGPAALSAEPPFIEASSRAAARPRTDSTVVTIHTTEHATQPVALPLIARNWTHVRSRRTVNAPLEAVLTPGDTVVADSLANGWYRVALYGEVLGYARETTLAPTPQ
jgi:hypothetical protein